MRISIAYSRAAPTPEFLFFCNYDSIKHKTNIMMLSFELENYAAFGIKWQFPVSKEHKFCYQCPIRITQWVLLFTDVYISDYQILQDQSSWKHKRNSTTKEKLWCALYLIAVPHRKAVPKQRCCEQWRLLPAENWRQSMGRHVNQRMQSPWTATCVTTSELPNFF